MNEVKAIVTVIGKDTTGIIAGVCIQLAEENINVLDISQTVLDGYFTMMMIVDVQKCDKSFEELRTKLKAFGVERGLDIRIQREDIFDSMYKI